MRSEKPGSYIRNPFQCDVDEIFNEAQEEFLELKFNSRAKDNFNELELEALWLKYLPVYPLISNQALRVLITFGSTYLCEAAFSILVASVETRDVEAEAEAGRQL